MRAASLFQQQLGCVTPEAFGLAVGLPHRRIVSLDTDGGMMFNLGIWRRSRTNGRKTCWCGVGQRMLSVDRRAADPYRVGQVDLAAIARGAGIEHAYTVRDLDDFSRRCDEGLQAQAPFVIVAKVDRSVRRDIKRKHSDGREDKYMFVRHVEATEGVVIMGPSEHN